MLGNAFTVQDVIEAILGAFPDYKPDPDTLRKVKLMYMREFRMSGFSGEELMSGLDRYILSGRSLSVPNAAAIIREARACREEEESAWLLKQIRENPEPPWEPPADRRPRGEDMMRVMEARIPWFDRLGSDRTKLGFRNGELFEYVQRHG